MATEDICTNDSRLVSNGNEYRTCMLKKNVYTNEYCAGVPDTISDGDDKGRDPKDENGDIGTCIDIKMRNCSLTKNRDLYTTTKPYGLG